MPRIWLLRLCLLLVLLSAGWAVGCGVRAGRRPGWTAASGKVRVLTTIFPLYDFAREVGGDAVEVRNLLPAGVDPHEYALSPSDASLVAHADLLISNGRGVDDFLMTALQKADQVGRRPLVCSDGLPALQAAAGDEHAGGDPHLWLDPVLARRFVARIAESIESALRQRGRADEAESVARRAAAYDRELMALDQSYQKELAGAGRAPFIAFHSAYGYLAKRYGLDMAAVWEPSPGRQPGPREVGRLLDLARAKQVRIFFSEPGFSPHAVEMVAQDARLAVRQLDPIETAEDFRSARYLNTARNNLRVLRDSLSSSKGR